MEEKLAKETVSEAPEKKSAPKGEDGIDWVFTRFIVKNGKRIYPKSAKFFRFPRYKKAKIKSS